MSSASPDLVSRRTNPLFLPMVIVSSLAFFEAIALVVLVAMLARQNRPPAQVVSTPAAASAAQGGAVAGKTPSAAGASPQAAADLPHGKRGERVDSSGFAITVESISHQPVSDPLGQVTDERRYLALLLLVENNSGGSLSFYDTAFCLQDGQSFEYKPLAMKLTAPALQWRHLGNREQVRGYVDFIVPKSSKKLTLIYTHLARPIHIELDE